MMRFLDVLLDQMKRLLRYCCIRNGLSVFSGSLFSVINYIVIMFILVVFDIH